MASAPPLLPHTFFGEDTSSDTFVSCVLRSTNSSFNFFHKWMLTALLWFVIPLSPFVGFGVAFLAAALAVFARVLQPFSLAFGEHLWFGGYGRTTVLWLAHRRRELAKARGDKAVVLPRAGFLVGASAPPLLTFEVGFTTAPVLVGYLTKGYRLGFAFGAITMAIFMCLASPAIALYSAGADIFSAILLRPWLRAFSPDDHMQPGGDGSVTSQAAALMLEDIGIDTPWPECALESGGTPDTTTEDSPHLVVATPFQPQENESSSK
jgi:hypothetical protein